MATDFSFLLEEEEKVEAPISHDFSFLLDEEPETITPIQPQRERIGATRSFAEPSLLQKTTRILPDIGTGITAGFSDIPYTFLKGVSGYFDYVSKKHARENPEMVAIELKKQREALSPEELQKGRDFNRNFYKEVGKKTKALQLHVEDDQEQRFATKFGRGLSSLAASAVPSVIAFQVWGSSYEQAKQQGKTDDKAAEFAGTQALLQEVSERIGNFALGKIFTGSGGLLKKAGKSFLSEGTQEATQEGIAIGVEKAFDVKDNSSKFKRIIEAFGIGGLTGAAASVVLAPRTPAQTTLKPVDDFNFLLEDKGIQEKTKDLPTIDQLEEQKPVDEKPIVPIEQKQNFDFLLEEDTSVKKPLVVKKEVTKKIQKEVITEKDIRKRVKQLREEKKESMPIQFKESFTKGVKIPIGMESDFNDILKKHKIKINKEGIPLDIAIQQFSEQNGTASDINEFMNEIDSLAPVDLSTEALKTEISQSIDDNVEVLKTKAQAFRMAINRAFTDKTQTQQEIKQSIIDYAKENLVLNDRGKLLSTVKNAKTEKNLEKALDMMNQFAEKTKKSGLRVEITKELKTTKPLKVSGKPKGKFTPAIQTVLDVMKRANKLNKSLAQGKLELNLSKDITSPEIAMENLILNVKANSETMSSSELQEALDNIVSLKETGRFINEQGKASFKEDIETKKDKIVNVIEGTVGKEKSADGIQKEPEPVTRKDADGLLKNKVKSIGKSLFGWNDVMDIISVNDKTSVAYNSDLNKIAKVSDVETAEKKGNRIAFEKVKGIASEIFDIKSDRKLVKKFIDDSKIYLKIGKLELTKSQARKRWMEFQDPSLIESFDNMGYSSAVRDKISDSLSAEDKAFAQAQLDFYKDYYNEINEIYKQLNGINLPQGENHSPIRKEDFGKETESGDFLNEVRHRTSIAPGSLKRRTANKLPLAQLSDIETLQKHIGDMEHFKSWALKIRELNSIFNDPTIRASIKKQFGKNTLGVVDGFIEDFTRGRIDTSKNFNWIDQLRVNFTTSVLSLKPALAIKQLVSIPAYAENIPTTEFIEGTADFFRNPIQNTKILMESELLKARGQNLTRDIRDAMKTKEFSAFKKNPSFRNSLMLFTKMGDKGAILVGGWSNYRYARKQGKSHAEALQFFEEQTSQAQQSADLSQLSVWQRGSSFTKLFSMFTSSQNQYFRREAAAIRNLLAGRTTKKQAAKTIAIYHFILPMLFQFVANGFKWDDDDELRAAIMGSFNGVFILKDVLGSVIRTVQKERTFGFGLPLWDSVEEFNRALRKIDWDDISMEDIIDAGKSLASAGGLVSGYGVKEMLNKYEGVKDFIDDDKEQGTKRFLGWSKWALTHTKK